ncbi:MAG TPA: carboxypeptidase regulatory-like domain-containing protein, partial [Pyrinomonadaceae bacterium]
FLERAQNAFPLAGNVLDANFVDDGLRGGGSTSNITGHVQNATGVGLYNVAIALSGTASRTVYTDNAGLYLLPNLPAGTYQVTPSKAGVVFTPANRPFTFSSGQTITDADFATQDSFNISGQSRDQNGAALSDVTISLNNGQTVQTDSNGYYSFDAAAGGSYTLTAAKANLSFTPANQSIAALTANQKNVDFTVYLTTTQTPVGQNVAVQLNGVNVNFANVTGAGTTTIMPINPAAAGQLPNGYLLFGDSVAFDISTTATAQPPISVCFNVPFVSDATFFAQLRILHNENGALIDRTASHDFANKVVCANVNSLSAFVLASSSLPLLQLLLEESGSTPTDIAALDAILLLRDPFSVLNTNNLLVPGTDRNTRVLVLVKNLQLQSGESPAVVTVNLVDSSGRNYDVIAESVQVLPAFEFMQINFRLPDGLAPGACTVQIKAHDQVSNVGVIRIRL